MAQIEGNKVVVALGAGRCGTSLLMQVLSKLKLSLSQNLIPAKAHNPLGPMEDAELANVYDDLLLQTGSNRLLPFSMDLFPNCLKASVESQLSEITSKNIEMAETIWGFKDPFTSFILPLWFSIFDKMDIVPVFLLTVRNPIHSVLSRKKHFETMESIGELAWISNYLSALKYTSADCHIIHYEEWFTRGDDMAVELLDYTGLRAYNKNVDVKETLQNVVQSNLNRAIHEEYAINNKSVTKLYEALRKCRGHNYDRQALMQVVNECHEEMEMFKGWYQQAHGALKNATRNTSLQGEIEQLKKQVSSEKSRSEHLGIEKNELSDEIEELKVEISHLLAEQKNQHSFLKKIESESLQREQEINALNKALIRSQKSLLEIKDTTSFKLGNLIVMALIVKPGLLTLRLPFDLIKLIYRQVFDRGKTAKGQNGPDVKEQVTPSHGELFDQEVEENSSSINLQQLANIKISIIIPIFNKEEHLPHCLDSIRNITGCNFEIICIDDCSSDNSVSIVLEYSKKDKRIKPIFLEKNQGAGAARNIGILSAGGEYVFFVDADDLISENGLKKMIEVALRDDCDIVRGKITGIKENGDRHILAGEYFLQNEELHNKKWEEDESLWFYWYFTACLYKREFLHNNFIQFPEGIRNEDPVFLCRCFLGADKISAIKDVVYHYRIGQEQKKKTPSQPFLVGWVQGYYEIFRLIKGNEIQTQFFIAHFPSLVTHVNNIVSHLEKELAKELLTKLHSIYKNARHEYFADSNSQPWKRKKRYDWMHILYAFKLHDENIDALYDFLIVNSKKKKIINHGSQSITESDMPLKAADSLIQPRKPAISVVIPVYNTEAYIRQCLESLQLQSFQNFEAICVDDSTRDRSMSIVEEFFAADPRFKVVKHEKNRGLPASRNSGIQNANGKYVYFLDSDDWIEPDALKLLHTLAERDGVDIAMGGVLKYDEDTGKKYPGNHEAYLKKNFKAVTVFEKPEIGNAVISCNKLIRKSFIEETGLYFSEIPRRFEDVLTHKWFLCGARVSLNTKTTYIYRQRSRKRKNSSIMQSTDLAVYSDRFLAFAGLAEFEKKYGLVDTPCKGYDLVRMLSWTIPHIQKELSNPDIEPALRDDILASFKKLCASLASTYFYLMPEKIKSVCLSNANMPIK